MKVYIASSWKNEQLVLNLAKLLREDGKQEVYCFAEMDEGQHHFNWPDVLDVEKEDGISALITDDSIKAYNSDKWSLDWANCCLLVLPCGRDAHLEAGYIKGKGGKLYIIGHFPKGEFSNMYHLANRLYKWEGLPRMISYMRNCEGA